jgi:hypothetical protein
MPNDSKAGQAGGQTTGLPISSGGAGKAAKSTMVSRSVRTEHPMRDMKFYTIGASELSMLAASGFSGSAALSFVGYFYKQWQAFKAMQGFPKEVIDSAFNNMVIFSAFTAIMIIVFVRTVATIKRESGQAWYTTLLP